jgi:hypothetical protein
VSEVQELRCKFMTGVRRKDTACTPDSPKSPGVNFIALRHVDKRPCIWIRAHEDNSTYKNTVELTMYTTIL